MNWIIALLLLLPSACFAQNWGDEEIIAPVEPVKWSTPLELPKRESSLVIRRFNITQHFDYQGEKTLRIEATIFNGFGEADYKWVLSGQEYNTFYGSWLSCDKVFQFIYEKMGANVVIEAGEGERLCYNVIPEPEEAPVDEVIEITEEPILTE